jgi:hypothetical protein
MNPPAEPGPVDDAQVDQRPGGAEGLSDAQPGDGSEREVGVTAAVERGPAELSSEGEPVHEDEHISLTGEEPARSTDEL